MKPLMMMRTKGISGPAFAKHAGISKLSKSVGNFVSASKGQKTVPVPNNDTVICELPKD